MLVEKVPWYKVSKPCKRTLVNKETNTAQSFDKTAFLQKVSREK
jgi:hypothetical protein